MAASFSCAAPAKINLALHVVGRRADGYHLIESLVAFAALGDRVTVDAADADDFSISGPYAGQLLGASSNLVLQARDLLRRRHPKKAAAPVAIRLEKNLPVASGIGGGSSDAAAALRALVQFWMLEEPEAELAQAALALGADLPMCLLRRPLVATGIGEELRPIAGFPALAIVLVNPGVPVATPAVFRGLESKHNARLPALPSQLSIDTTVDWLGETRNDLQAPAQHLAPEIGAALRLLDTAGARLARMSGSGATCFGIFSDGIDAAKAAATIAREKPSWFVRSTPTLSSEERHDD